MTQRSNATTQPKPSASLAKPVLTGAAIGLALISLFLAGVDDADPAWGKYWMMRPLLIVPLAGACGGAFYYFMNRLSYRGKLNKTVAVILSLAVYITGLFLGTVLGLDGTLWD